MTEEVAVVEPAGEVADEEGGRSHSVVAGTSNGADALQQDSSGESALAAVDVIVDRTAKELAQDLDAAIDKAIVQFSKTLAKAYVDLGSKLQKMRDTGWHKHVGFDTWQKYLAAKRERIGKTYCSYVIKLANTEGLTPHLDDITGAQLIEYSKVLKAEEIVPAIKATKAQVKGMSARATNNLLQEYRVKTLGKPARKERAVKGVEDILAKMLNDCASDEERKKMKAAAKRFLNSN